MTLEQVAASYDRIADRWLDVSTYRFAQIERAVAFVKHKGWALDVGCGTGRFMGLLSKQGFRTDGLDVSPAMIALARERHPEARLFHADICRWQLPQSYDLIVAWDSVWHVPLGQQEAVLTKLCRGLSPGGVLVFTTGGTGGPSEKQDSCMGLPIYHATLGIPKTLHALAEAGCVCRHLEYDQHALRVEGQVQAGAEADLQHVPGNVNEQFSAVPGHQRPVQEEVTEAREDDLCVEAH